MGATSLTLSFQDDPGLGILVVLHYKLVWSLHFMDHYPEKKTQYSRLPCLAATVWSGLFGSKIMSPGNRAKISKE